MDPPRRLALTRSNSCVLLQAAIRGRQARRKLKLKQHAAPVRSIKAVVRVRPLGEGRGEKRGLRVDASRVSIAHHLSLIHI